MSAWSARLAARLVWVYQVALRPLLPPACRFEPSCSEYSRQVLLTHGLAGGAWLSIRRIARCHPWHAGGYDPPPAAPSA
jgi:putative membrane protein insertion efficiency factor